MRLAPGDHVVQFYDTVDGLASIVAGYLSAAIADGDAVIVIASPGHRELFRSGLVAAGVDIDTAKADGRLVTLDAATTAAGFIVGGSIDRVAFEAVVGAPVRQAAAQHRGVRVYGEMVALLWSAGDVQAAMDLERLWNELAESVPFALFCAYPGELVCDPLAGEAFSEVCHLHSTVVAGAPSLPESEVSRRFPGTVPAAAGPPVRRRDPGGMADRGGRR